eukprot:scaffold107_cov54-Attheya_sp.AAC.4
MSGSSSQQQMVLIHMRLGTISYMDSSHSCSLAWQNVNVQNSVVLIGLSGMRNVPEGVDQSVGASSMGAIPTANRDAWEENNCSAFLASFMPPPCSMDR